MRAGELIDRIHTQPFRILLGNGDRLGATDPLMVIVGRTDAVVPTAWGTVVGGRRLAKRWRTIALADIVRAGCITA